MAITYKQAGKLSKKGNREVRELENRIDEEIIDNFPDTKVAVRIGQVDDTVFDELERRYNRAGWKVDYNLGESDLYPELSHLFLKLRRKR